MRTFELVTEDAEKGVEKRVVFCNCFLWRQGRRLAQASALFQVLPLP